MLERIRFERELQELGLREYDSPKPPREVAVGERINLNIKDFIDAGTDATDVEWTVPNTRIAFYDGDRKNVVITKHKNDDLKKAEITFYWVDAQDNREVRAHFKSKSGKTQTEKDIVVTYNVKAPTLDRFDSATKPVWVGNKKGSEVVRFGKNNKEAPGIKWDWQVTMPANYGGSIKDLQTILVNQEETNLKSGKQVRRVRKHPTNPRHEQLDQAPLDKGTEATYSSNLYGKTAFPVKVAAGKTLRQKDTWDSPGTSLDANGISLSVNNSFKYFILYKPDTTLPKKAGLPPPAIWVPVAKAEWVWQAEVKKEKDKKGKEKWILKSGEGKETAQGAKTVEFPDYNSNVNANQWIEVP